jgi:hypothetical protein
MAIKTNITVDQGANFAYNVYLVDTDGNPFDLTGYTANSQIRKTYTSTTFNTISTTVNAVAGSITLTMNSVITANLSSTRYVYDLELYFSNVTSRIIEGFVTVNPGVTR